MQFLSFIHSNSGNANGTNTKSLSDLKVMHVLFTLDKFLTQTVAEFQLKICASCGLFVNNHLVYLGSSRKE